MAPPVDLESLIARIAARDAGAFAAFYDRTAAFVFGLLVHILNDRPAAEEVAQEVYLQLWRSPETFDARRSSGLTWITMVARSRALDRLRSDASDKGAMQELPVRHHHEDPRSPEEDAILSEHRSRVRAALGSLPPEQRSIIELAFFQGLSHGEISQRTGTPMGTVETRIRDAIHELERTLGALVGLRRGGS